MKPKYYAIALTLVVVLHIVGRTPAGEGCCQHCGCQNSCEKVCRLVREDKKISITCWGCKCEDFCAPGKSCRGCKNGEEVCTDCEPEIRSQSKTFVWFDWEPGCAKHIYTKKKLMRRTETKTVPGFKWVVEELCHTCRDACPVALIPAGSAVPPPPVPDGVCIINGIELARAASGGEVRQVSAFSRNDSLETQALTEQRK